MNVRLAEYLFYLSNGNYVNALASLEKEPLLLTSLTDIYDETMSKALINAFKLAAFPRNMTLMHEIPDNSRLEQMSECVDNIMSSLSPTLYNNRALMTLVSLPLLEYYYELDKQYPCKTTDGYVIKILGYCYMVVKEHCADENLKDNMLSWLDWYENKSAILYDELPNNMAKLIVDAVSNEDVLMKS